MAELHNILITDITLYINGKTYTKDQLVGNNCPDGTPEGMFEIIDSFIDGEITDVQCQHCLSATNLGNQYVFVNDKALSQLKILRHCYLAPDEKEYYLSNKREESRVGNDKVKVARRQYRGQGEYIEDILK